MQSSARSSDGRSVIQQPHSNNVLSIERVSVVVPTPVIGDTSQWSLIGGKSHQRLDSMQKLQYHLQTVQSCWRERQSDYVNWTCL